MCVCVCGGGGLLAGQRAGFTLAVSLPDSIIPFLFPPFIQAQSSNLHRLDYFRRIAFVVFCRGVFVWICVMVF